MITNLLETDFYELLVLSINLIATLSYLVIINNEKAKKSFYKLPKIFQKGYVLLFVLPLIITPFLSVIAFKKILFVKVIGLIVSFGGVIFILFSFIKIGVVPSISKSNLITTGMYGIVRHPIYTGTLLLFLGFILFNSSIISLVYFPFSILLYCVMTIFEERDLEKTFGDEYKKYKHNVKFRLIPFIV